MHTGKLKYLTLIAVGVSVFAGLDYKILLDSLCLSFALVTKTMRMTRADRALLLEDTVAFCH